MCGMPFGRALISLKSNHRTRGIYYAGKHKGKDRCFRHRSGDYLPQFPSLVPEFEGQYAAFKKTLPDPVELIDGGIVTTKELAQAAGDKFRAADVDLVIMQLLTYATSYRRRSRTGAVPPRCAAVSGTPTWPRSAAPTPA